ncbi:MAG: trypsin-like peptidase domain-containing protein [Candidatus Paceibacterota bacterium]
MFDTIATILEAVLVAITAILAFLGIATTQQTFVYIQDITPAPQVEESGEKPQEIEESPEEVPIQPLPENTTRAEKEEALVGKDFLETLQESSTAVIPLPIPKKITLSGVHVNQTTREAVVNIFCLPAHGGFFNPISASGVIIDERGVILTNAHVAQYFLLETYQDTPFINCVIRTGSPARVAYTAEPLFISSSWIDENIESIIKPETTSTGENDFAFLYITGTTNPNTERPESFPSLDIFPLSKTIRRGDPVLVAGYPAGFLGGITISRDLWVSSSITLIKEIFTFSEEKYGPLDLVSVGGIITAQEGSSGGAVVDMYDNNLLGIITLRTEGDTTSTRDLRALTLQHINRSLLEESGESVEKLLSGNLVEKKEGFASTSAPALKAKLVEVLEN